MNQRLLRNLALFGGTALIVAQALFYVACGSSGSSSSSAAFLSGAVQLGPVDGATVTVYKLNGDGTTGDKLKFDGGGDAETTTNSSGVYNFTAKFTTDGTTAYEGAVTIEAIGGTYKDEATGETKTRAATDKIKVIIPVVTAEALAQNYADGVPLTSGTNAMAARAIAAKQAGFEWADACTSAVKEFKEAYGFSPYTMPYNPNEAIPDPNSARAVAMTTYAGMAEAAYTAGVPPHEYALKLADDFKDGNFNGKYGNTAVTFSTGAALTTDPVGQILAGMNAWDHLPPGVNSPKDFGVTSTGVNNTAIPNFIFDPTPTNYFESVKGYYSERDEFNTKYSPYLDPYISTSNYASASTYTYIPTMDSHNGAAYDSSKDPCNSAGAAFDMTKCPTNQNFSVSAFTTYYESTLKTASGTYDPKTGTYTNSSGTVYQPGTGGAFVTSAGESVPPPNTSSTGTSYSQTFTPGTTCAAGTYWDTASASCKTNPTTTTGDTTTGPGSCTGGRYWDGTQCRCSGSMVWNGSLCVASLDHSIFGRFKQNFQLATTGIVEFLKSLF